MYEIVAIVGKPNVGKSTLFNRIINQKMSVTSPIPGVTRDRVIAPAEWNNIKFNLVDTGGITDELTTDIERAALEQSEQAILNADVIIFTLDAQTGITSLDENIFSKLRKTNKPVIMVINKIDDFEKHTWDEFYKFGFKEIVPVSAEHGKNIGELLDKITAYLKGYSETIEFSGIKLAIVGRPNVGKSSILNKLAGETRSIVSEIPGTTRDSVNIIIKYEKKNYLIVDTAGLRKKNKITDDVEHYSVLRTIKSINDCDIALLVIDAERGLDEQELKIANLIIEDNKGLIIVVNKWDLIEKDSKTSKQIEDLIYKKAAFIKFAPIVFVSALTGQRLVKIFELADEVYKNLKMRVPTSVLQKLANDIKLKYSMPANKGKRMKLNFLLQVDAKAPTFVVHITHPELITQNFRLFLINKLRETFVFTGAPINLFFKKK